VGFLGHFGDLGQAGGDFCEAGHIRPPFFAAGLLERVGHIGIGIGTGVGLPSRQGQAMSQRLQPRQFQTWRSADGERLWLSMLVDTMEQVSRPEIRSGPCEISILLALREQLARPASAYAYGASHFSLRN
jgi:hypothetical protein